MSSRSSLATLVLFSVAMIGTPLRAVGQGTTAPTVQFPLLLPLQFDFTTPGARSLAMGGAFLGSSDDASAAFTNPAGLVFYGRLEVSFEGRFGTQATSHLAGGRISGQVTGIDLDISQGPTYADDTDRRVGLSFVSMMIPVKRRIVFTGYRHEVARMDNAFFSQGVFLRGNTFGDAIREAPSTAERDISVTNYGGAVGVKVNETLAVGGGISLYRFGFDTVVERHPLQAGLFGPADAAHFTVGSALGGDDWAVSVNGGVLWIAHRSVHLGASFRRGPRFDFAPAIKAFDESPVPDGNARFKVPDVWGAGLKWIPLKSERLRLMFDTSRVYYSQLRDDFINDQAEALGRPGHLSIADAVELRAGAEYQFGDTHVVIPRVGMWRDPDHAIRYTSTPARDATDLYYEAALPDTGAVKHFTFGVGMVWSELFEVHIGSDLSSRSKLLTMSFVARFKRTGGLPTP